MVSYNTWAVKKSTDNWFCPKMRKKDHEEALGKVKEIHNGQMNTQKTWCAVDECWNMKLEIKFTLMWYLEKDDI